MKKEFIIDRSLDYISPLCTVMAFEPEGILCQSKVDGDHDDFENGGGFDFTGDFKL